MATNYNQYSKTPWVNNETKVNASNMNKIENAIEDTRENTIDLKVILDDFITAFRDKLSLTYSGSTLTLQIGDSETDNINQIVTATINTSAADVEELLSFVSQVAHTYKIYNNILKYVTPLNAELSASNVISESETYKLYYKIDVANFKQFNSLPTILYLNNNTSGLANPIKTIAFLNANDELINAVISLPTFPLTIPENTKYISICLFLSAVNKVDVSLYANPISDYNIYKIKENIFETVEYKANKVSSFSSTPSHNNYPTEKLVKDSLDLKADKSELTPLATQAFVQELLATHWTVNIVETLPTPSASTIKKYYLTKDSTSQEDGYSEYITLKDELDNYYWERLGFAGAIDLASLSESIAQQLQAKIDVTQKGAAGGVATLDANGKVPSSQLPTPDHSALEEKANKVTSFGTTPSDNKYPSEKLVKDSLDLKANLSDLQSKANVSDLANKLEQSDLNGYATESYVQSALAGLYTIQIVQTLPTASASTMRKYYLVKDDTNGQDLYSEYITIEITNSNNQTTYSWERLGYAGAVDLSNLIQGISDLESGYADLSDDLSALDNSKLNKAAVGAANGVAELNSSGKVPDSQIDLKVIEGYYYNSNFYTTSEHTTVITGVTGKLYVDLSQNKLYRYNGSAYQQISYVEIPTVVINENTVKFNSDLYAYTNIGKVTASNLNPVKIASAGDSLKTALTAILGEQQDVNPTITNNTSITITPSPTTTTYSGDEVGTQIAQAQQTFTITVSDAASANFGIITENTTYYDKINGKSFIYPIKTLTYNNNNYNIRIQCTTPSQANNFTATTGSIVARDTTNGYLYCLLSNKQLVLKYNMSAVNSTSSEQERVSALTALVKFETPKYNNENITAFCTYLGESYTTSGLSAPADKSKTTTKIKISAGKYYIYKAVTNSSTAPTIAITNTNIAVGNTEDFAVSYSSGDYLYVYHTSNSKKLQYFAANTWYDVPDVTVLQTATEITLSNSATANYYIYKVGPFLSAASMQFRMVNA